MAAFFHQHHSRETKPSLVLVSFWAPWCTPCHRLPYILDKVETDMKGMVAIHPVNVQESPYLTEEFEITSLPTLLVLHKGRVLKRLHGLHSYVEIKNCLYQYI